MNFRARLSRVFEFETSHDGKFDQLHRLGHPRALLCAIVTAAVCGVQIWMYIRAAISILKLNSDSSQENRHVKTQALWAQLVFYLYGIITGMGVLGWLKLVGLIRGPHARLPLVAFC